MSQDNPAKKIFDGRYEILGIVGRGAASVVYHARDINNPQLEVALKVLKPQRGGSGEHPTNAERLRKEALAMVSSRHRYVIRLDDFHSVDDLCYLAMEFAPESDLRRYRAKRGGTLPIADIENYLGQAAEALAFMHKGQVIHRDLKPENILVISEQEIRLGDFGVAVLPGEESSLVELQRGVGTMSYMAPEVLSGVRYDEASDVYALGVTFYELLTGKHPFDGAPLMQQLDIRKDDAFPNPRSLNPEIPEYLATVIMQAMSFDAPKRFPSGVEFVQALRFNRTQAKGKKRFSLVDGGHTEATETAGIASEPSMEARAPREPSRVNEVPLATDGAAAREAFPDQTTESEAALPQKQSNAATEPISAVEPQPLTDMIEKEVSTPTAAEPPAPASESTPGSGTLDLSPSSASSAAPIRDLNGSPEGAQPDEGTTISAAIQQTLNLDVVSSAEHGPAQAATEPVAQLLQDAVGAESIPFPTSSALTAASSTLPGSGIVDSAIDVAPVNTETVESITNSGPSDAAISEAAPSSAMVDEPRSEETSAQEPTGSVVSDAVQAAASNAVAPSSTTKSKIGIPRAPGGIRSRSPAPKLSLRSKAKVAATTDAAEPTAALTSEPMPAAAEAATVASPNTETTNPTLELNTEAAPATIKPGVGLDLDAISAKLGLEPRRLKILMAALLASIVVGLFIGGLGMSRSRDAEVSAINNAATSGTGPVIATDLLPAINSRDFTFPELPRGIYSGTISGIRPGAPLLLNFVVLNPEELVVIVGLEGWTPRPALLDRPTAADGSTPIRVAANGLILDFVGANVDGEIIGGFTNVVTGARGEWRVRPIGS